MRRRPSATPGTAESNLDRQGKRNGRLLLASFFPETAATLAELLRTEYGFSDAQVAHILEATERAAVDFST